MTNTIARVAHTCNSNSRVSLYTTVRFLNTRLILRWNASFWQVPVPSSGSAKNTKALIVKQPFQLVRRGYDAIADMIRNRDYDQAVTALLNPKEYTDAIAVKGEWLKAVGQPIKAVAPTLSRFLPQQQQVPQNIQQFAQPQPSR